MRFDEISYLNAESIQHAKRIDFNLDYAFLCIKNTLYNLKDFANRMPTFWQTFFVCVSWLGTKQQTTCKPNKDKLHQHNQRYSSVTTWRWRGIAKFETVSNASCVCHYVGDVMLLVDTLEKVRLGTNSEYGHVITPVSFRANGHGWRLKIWISGWRDESISGIKINPLQ